MDFNLDILTIASRYERRLVQWGRTVWIADRDGDRKLYAYRGI